MKSILKEKIKRRGRGRGQVVVWLDRKKRPSWGVTHHSSFLKTEAGLWEWGRRIPGRLRGICFGLEAIRCLVPSSEVIVVTMERNYRDRDRRNERIVHYVALRVRELQKLKLFLVHYLVNLLSNSHVYSSLNSRCLLESLTYNRCAINIYWIRWLVNCSFYIRFFFSTVRVEIPLRMRKISYTSICPKVLDT